MINDLIMVVAHKPFDVSILPDGYIPIKVGQMLESSEMKSQGWLTDDTGNNIADENPWYCELTAQYWVWKNWNYKDTSVIGLSHYRRFFFEYQKDSKHWKNDILTMRRAKEILKTHRIIMNYPTVKLPGMAYLFKHIPDSQQNKHWSIISKIVSEYYPEMMDTFNKYMFGHFIVWGNMFVTTGGVLREYSEWLFDVMKKYDQEIEKRGEERIPRVDGYLTELLLLIWVNYKFKPDQIYHLEVRNIEQDSFVDYSSSLKGKLIHLIRCHKWALNIARYLRIGILLIVRSNAFHKEI